MGSLELRSGSRVYVDSQIVIYSLERHPAYGPLLMPLWMASRDGQIQVITSELTLLEVLVRPMRDGNSQLQAAYRALLLRSEISLHPVTQEVLQEAAKLRATEAGLRTPDAIHVATARATQCEFLLTNDRTFSKVGQPQVLQLEDVLNARP